MRFLLLSILAVGATNASAQRVGERTAAPLTHLPATGLAPEDQDLAAIQAAAAFPLGSLENPIRVGGPDGARLYVARLRCPDGTTPRSGAAETGTAGGFGTITQVQSVTCGAQRARLHFDLYHEEHVERRAPEGFTLLGG